MDPALRFALLGQVRAWRGDVEVDLGSRQQRAVLAVLLLREGQPLPVDEAARELWGDDVPRGAASTIRTYVYRLRRILGGGGPGLITSSGGGYVLAVDPLAVDVGLFRHHIHKAREALRSGDTSSAAAGLRAGLALWQGTPLSGAVGPGSTAHRVRLEQMRAAAVVDELAVSIELGCHVEAVSELTALVSRHPLRERLWELLILALYRSGQRAEALAAYRDIRRLLRDELGLEPGAGLRELHARILADDGSPTAPITEPVVTPTPAQLPADTADFVGRSPEITWITDRLLCPDGPALVGITGFTGMGKTALATHVARSVRHHFRDGQLFATLSTPGGPPVDPGEILAGFLAAFGIGRDRLPAAVGERSALWRTLLTERRILVVLDDADSSEQVLPLLPAAPSSAVIVTSWRRLIDLPGLRSVAVGPLADEDALTLMGRLAGHERLRAEPCAAEGIVAECSAQPLAVRISAARLLARPRETVHEVHRQIREDFASPVVLDEDRRAASTRFEWAMSRLAPELAAACRRIALCDHDLLDVPAVAPLLGVEGTEARRILEALVGVHLLEAVGGGRYRFLTLVRAEVRRHALRPSGVSPRAPADDFPAAHAAPTAASSAGALPLTAARACRP
ncbi:AfsR/SARP family transcriptional regulator [Pseudonocardia alaniniphila]|uniref:Winged helix-turn-helix domain-containing protein n=1 Tax=Pseudonocardia alaniniphila TaxID=75291 RepID=A0ABS9TJI3_9PSEU|nr:AfsR/SARP family transcriptional regulator [Pseudonocardia alaniniphila]MCH6168702.1 winged helix-turn-helix domain-containing protein [Pseudonocardia alaniniphila]